MYPICCRVGKISEVILGGGFTVIVKVAVDENPGVLVAVHVIVVVPTLKKLPET